MGHELSVEEVRSRFLTHVRGIVDYWDEVAREPSLRKRLEGVAFTILSTIDGSAADLPAFALIPTPHPTDKAFSQEQGEDWYPDFQPAQEVCDIAGGLHERFYHPRAGERTGG